VTGQICDEQHVIQARNSEDDAVRVMCTAGGMTDIEVQNERLHSTLNPASANLATCLLNQLALTHKEEGASRRVPTGTSEASAVPHAHFYRTPPSPRRTAFAVNAAAQAHVLDGYQPCFPPPYRPVPQDPKMQ
jgi:hypothetical protein